MSRTRAKTRAEDNPWYILMTLHEATPGNGGSEAQIRNRLAWNRYVATFLDPRKAKIAAADARFEPGDLVPLSPEERAAMLSSFRARAGASADLPLPRNNVIDLSNLEFSASLSLTGYIFPIAVSFAECSFQGAVDFVEVLFLSWVDFDDAVFEGPSVYQDAAFLGAAGFRRAIFKRTAQFEAVDFRGGPDFHMAVFNNNTAFENCVFGNVTSFHGVNFRFEPPRFFGAKLHEGTLWREVAWPLTPSDKSRAESFLEAYERLKLEMDRLKKHEDELIFFSHELRCRRVINGFWAGLPIALYGFGCDYGRSYIRPLVIALFIVAYGAIPYFFLWGDAGSWRAIGLSLSNTFALFGFRREFFEAATITRLPDALKALAALQTVLGSVCFFLFGLALRNRFRMR